ncbi:MAG: transposase [Akkermansia sp.]|nr:transposase [Akkermansia sp.]
MIDETEPRISVSRRCQLPDLSKSRYYYTEKRSEIAKAGDKQAKQIILAWLLKDPCLGYRRLTTHVSNALQYQVNRKYVRRLMKELGDASFFCKISVIVAKHACKLG